MNRCLTIARNDGASAVVSDEELAEALQQIVSRSMGVSMQSLRRETSRFTVLALAERVEVLLENGQPLSLFAKYVSGAASDHPDKQRRDREPRVYEEILASAEALPVPRFYGSFKYSQGRCVVLEQIDDWSLRYQDLEHWHTAAGEIARLHAHFGARASQFEASDILLQLDATYLWSWARRAAGAAATVSEDLARRVDDVLATYDPAVKLLARQSLTLVHNDLAPKNVIADRRVSPARICIVDWEMAGIGCGLMDLAHLCYGLPSAADKAMVSAYRRSARDLPFVPADEREFEDVLNACRLHQTLYRLAHCGAGGLPRERAAAWVTEAEAFAARFRTPRRRRRCLDEHPKVEP